MEEKGITQEIADSYDTVGPMYRTAIKFNTGNRPRAEIQKDIIEEIGHIKNLGFRDFKIGFHNIVDETIKEYMIYDLHIVYCGFDEILYLNGNLFIHYNGDKDDTYHRKFLSPVSLEPDEAAGEHGIIQFVDEMMDAMFSLMLLDVLSKEEMEKLLYTDTSLQEHLTEEQLRKLGMEIAPKFRVIFTAEEDILNSNPVLQNEHANNCRMKYLYSDNNYFTFKHVADALPGSKLIRDDFEFLKKGAPGKVIQKVLDLMMKSIPMILVGFRIEIPEERRHLFEGMQYIMGAIFLSLVDTQYQHFKEDPIVYAIDNCGQTVPGHGIQLSYDILQMKDNVTRAATSACDNLLKQANAMDPEGKYTFDNIEAQIAYRDPNITPVKQAKELYMKTSKDIENEYRKENPNYDKRKLFN